jgi:hypothetical protein
MLGHAFQLIFEWQRHGKQKLATCGGKEHGVANVVTWYTVRKSREIQDPSPISKDLERGS